MLLIAFPLCAKMVHVCQNEGQNFQFDVGSRQATPNVARAFFPGVLNDFTVI
jgi:hypothetical protein